MIGDWRRGHNIFFQPSSLRISFVLLRSFSSLAPTSWQLGTGSDKSGLFKAYVKACNSTFKKSISLNSCISFRVQKFENFSKHVMEISCTIANEIEFPDEYVLDNLSTVSDFNWYP